MRFSVLALAYVGHANRSRFSEFSNSCKQPDNEKARMWTVLTCSTSFSYDGMCLRCNERKHAIEVNFSCPRGTTEVMTCWRV
jgi:hypothetical protein